jgi:histidine biosynthesis protein
MPGPIRTAARAGAPGPRGPALTPCLLLRKGEVCLPGPDGPTAARNRDGVALDPFDVVDRLAKDYSMLYVVDLDGLEHQEPQLDYLQEISRDMTMWVDGGVRTADQAIDILVAGARRAVLSSAYLQGPRQLKRAWRLSTELVFEMEFEEGRLALADSAWGTQDPIEIARIVREVGPDHLILSPRETDPDWSLVARVAAGGPTWVDGSFHTRDLSQLEAAGGAGGIFHIEELLNHWDETPLADSGSTERTSPARDDEN